jgi:hypothetical protein
MTWRALSFTPYQVPVEVGVGERPQVARDAKRHEHPGRRVIENKHSNRDWIVVCLQCEFSYRDADLVLRFNVVGEPVINKPPAQRARTTARVGG